MITIEILNSIDIINLPMNASLVIKRQRAPLEQELEELKVYKKVKLQDCSINKLGQYMLQEVFSFLDFKDIIACDLAQRNWANVRVMQLEIQLSSKLFCIQKCESRYDDDEDDKLWNQRCKRLRLFLERALRHNPQSLIINLPFEKYPRIVEIFSQLLKQVKAKKNNNGEARNQERTKTFGEQINKLVFSYIEQRKNIGKIIEACPNLKILKIENSYLHNKDLKALGKLKQLEQVHFNYNIQEKITDKILNYCEHVQLKSISFQNLKCIIEPSTLYQYVKQKGQKLESLSLNIKNFSSEDLIQIFQMHKCIKEVEIEEGGSKHEK